MALAAGGRRLFGFILLVEVLVATLAVIMQGLGLVGQALFFVQLGRFFALGPFARDFVAVNAFLHLVVTGQIGQRLVILVVVALAAAVFVKIRVLLGIRFFMFLMMKYNGAFLMLFVSRGINSLDDLRTGGINHRRCNKGHSRHHHH